MADPLETLYEDELTFVRRLALEFARDRPKIADRLLLQRETGQSEDPHVERLIEAFSLLTARVRLKLEDEFPELTDALLTSLYPHYLAPVPSMAVVQFQVDPQRCRLPQGYTIERHTNLFSREVQGTPCRFRTAYPVTLWPLVIQSARYQTAPFGRDVTPPPRAVNSRALLRLRISAEAGTSFKDLEIDRLRFFLHGDDPLVHKLYELIFNNVTQIMLRPATESTIGPKPVLLPPDAIQPVGFERDEGLLPYAKRSFLGYRLLTEYFTFPSKFLYFDLTGLEALRASGLTDSFELLLFLNRGAPGIEPLVSADTFRLGCSPIVNLFMQEADPIRLTETKTEYHIIPDVRNPLAMEVYSVDSVSSTNVETQETTEYRPFYSFKHAAEARQQHTYWHMQRRPSVRKGDQGTEVYLSLVDLDFNPRLPPVEVLMIKTTCGNRDIPGQLRATGGEAWGFQIEGQAPIDGIVPLVNPTMPARLPFGQIRWRLLSHLTLNHLSITDGEDGAEALREILKLYDYANNPVSQQYIDGITRVGSQRRVAPVHDGSGQAFCRGVEISIEFDEEKFTGSGVFLFASVLERFLGLYASINSATRLVARTRQREGILKQWPFRAGEQTLL